MSASKEHIAALLASLASPALKVIEPGLERLQALLGALGNPERALPPVIHAAGTNGKGSLLAYLTAVCEAAGLRTHRYISPHLMRFNERIYLAGRDITDEALEPLLLRVKQQLDAHPVTYFEATTAAAFLAFAQTPADIVLLETGMGGRLDATNVIDTPLLTAITPVSLDHCEYLGDTLQKVAAEKAGILKRGVPCIVGPQSPEALAVIDAHAQELQAPLHIYGRDWQVERRGETGIYISEALTLEFTPALTGEHQFINAGTAIACIEKLPHLGIKNDVLKHAISTARWPARLQQLNGKMRRILPHTGMLWLDGGHNPDAAHAIAAWAKQQPCKLQLICGMVEGKDTEAFLRTLAPYAAFLHAVDIPGEPTGKPASAIAEAAAYAGIPCEIQPSVSAALASAAQKEQNPLVLICGSLYLAGKVLCMDQE